MPILQSNRLTFLLALALLTMAAQAEEKKLVFDDFEPRVNVNFGQIVRGQVDNNALNHLAVNRNIVSLEQTGSYGESMEFKAGFLGILWWPMSVLANTPAERTVRVEPRLSEARVRWNFGTAGFGSDKNAGPGMNMDDKAGKTACYLDLGYFPYKYNRDAHDLGEYLYRSGTYPGVLYTSNGFQLLDHAAYDAYGAHAHYSQGNGVVTHDVNFFVEPNVIPTGDITPAYEVSLNLPVFQMGLGAAYNRLISFAPSQTRPKQPTNSFVEVDSASDGALAYIGPFDGASSAIKNAISNNTTTTFNYKVLDRWTQRGLKLMGRAALDLGFLIPEGRRGPRDLRLFSEVALLGVENQPFYYEDRLQRMPVMAGLNLPTFRLLDLLSFQTEYYGARFSNIRRLTENSLPIWLPAEWELQQPDFNTIPYADYKPENYRRDDWKWSLYAERKVGRLVKATLQDAHCTRAAGEKATVDQQELWRAS